jgi:hypothetical protein
LKACPCSVCCFIVIVANAPIVLVAVSCLFRYGSVNAAPPRPTRTTAGQRHRPSATPERAGAQQLTASRPRRSNGAPSDGIRAVMFF